MKDREKSVPTRSRIRGRLKTAKNPSRRGPGFGGASAWILAFPFWREAMGATSIGAGLFGALAFLARRRVAVVLFLVSFVLMVIGFAGHDILLADGARKYGVVGLVGSAIRMLAAFGFWRYAERAARLGYLA